jgi:hypothetical protein
VVEGDRLAGEQIAEPPTGSDPEDRKDPPTPRANRVPALPALDCSGAT